MIDDSEEVEHKTHYVNWGLLDATLREKVIFVDIPESKLYLMVTLYVPAAKPFGMI